MKIGAILTVARDAGLLLWGFGGIAYQQLSLPGAIGLLQLVRGRPEIPPTAGSSPVSPSSSLPPPS